MAKVKYKGVVVTMTTRARPQKFRTKKQFAEAVERYFASISRRIILTEPIVNHYDDKGKPQFKDEPILNLAGEKIMVIRFAIPPTLSGLCEYLDITRVTLNVYKQDDRFSETIIRARERIEKYLEEELLTSQKVQGIIFNLSNNFGWTDKKEVDLSEEMRMQMAAASVPLAEKIDKLKKIAALYANDDELR